MMKRAIVVRAAAITIQSSCAEMKDYAVDYLCLAESLIVSMKKLPFPLGCSLYVIVKSGKYSANGWSYALIILWGVTLP